MVLKTHVQVHKEQERVGLLKPSSGDLEISLIKGIPYK